MIKLKTFNGFIAVIMIVFLFCLFPSILSFSQNEDVPRNFGQASDDVRTMIEEYRVSLDKALQELVTVKMQNTQLQQQLTAKEQSSNVPDNEIQILKNVIKEYKTSLTKARDEISEANRINSQYLETAVNLQEKTKQLQEQNDRLIQEKETTVTSNNDEQIRQVISDYSRKIQELNTLLNQTKENETRKDKTIQDLKDALVQARAVSDKEIKQQLAQSQNRLKETEQKLQEQKKDNTALIALQDENVKLKNIITEKTQKLQDALIQKEQLTDLETEMKSKNQRIGILEEDARNYKIAAQSAEEIAGKKAFAEITDAKEKSESLKISLNKALNELSTALQQRDEAYDTQKRLEKKIDDFQSEQAKHNFDEKKQYIADNRELKIDIEKLSAALKKAETMYGDSMRKNVEIQQNNDELTVTVKTFEAQIDMLSAEKNKIAGLTEDNKKNAEILKAVIEQKDEQSKIVRDLQNELARKDQELLQTAKTAKDDLTQKDRIFSQALAAAQAQFVNEKEILQKTITDTQLNYDKISKDLDTAKNLNLKYEKTLSDADNTAGQTLKEVEELRRQAFINTQALEQKNVQIKATQDDCAQKIDKYKQILSNQKINMKSVLKKQAIIISAAAQKQIQQTQAQIEQINNAHQDQLKKLQCDKQVEFENLNKSLLECKSSLANSLKEFDAVIRENNDCKAAIVKLQDTIKSFDAGYNALFKEKEDKTKEFTETVASLRGQVKLLQDTLTVKETALIQEQTQAQTLRAQNEELTAQVKQSNDRFKAELDKKIKEQQTVFDNEKEQAQIEIKALKDSSEELKANLTKTLDQSQQYQTKTQELTDALDLINRKSSALQNQVTVLTDKAGSADNLSKQLETIRRQNQEYANTIEKLQVQIIDQKKQFTQQQVSDKTVFAREREDLTKTIEQYRISLTKLVQYGQETQAQIETQKNTIKTLENKIKEMGAAVKESLKKSEDARKQTAGLQLTQAENLTQKQQIAEQTKTIEILKRGYDSFVAEKEKTNKNTEALKEDIDKLKAQFDETSKQKNSMANDLLTLQNNISKEQEVSARILNLLQQQMPDMMTLITAKIKNNDKGMILVKAVQELVDQKNNLNLKLSRMEELSRQVKQLETDKTINDKNLMDLQAQLDSYKHQADSIRSDEAKKFNDNTKDLRQIVDEYKTQIETLQRKADELDNQNMEKTKIFTQAQNKIKELQAELDQKDAAVAEEMNGLKAKVNELTNTLALSIQEMVEIKTKKMQYQEKAEELEAKLNFLQAK